MSEIGNNVAAKSAQGTLSDRVRSLRLDDATEPLASGSSWRWAPWVICFVLLCATGLFALEALSPIDDDYLKKLAEERGLNLGNPGSSGGGQRLTLPGASNSSAATEIALESKGYIVPISLIQVSPKISGTVMKLNIEEGKEVQKGFLLAVLEDVEYRSDYDRAQSGLASARAKLEELRKYRADEIRQADSELKDAAAQYEQMELRYLRYIKLQQENKNALAPEDNENAIAAYKSTKARMDRMKLAFQLLRKGPRDEKISAAEADIAGMDADLRKAEWRFNNTKVVAPVTGIILSKKTEEGNIVNPSAFSNGLSASLCEMANLYKMEVDLSIAERDIGKVFKYQECRIRAEAFPNRLYTGHVSRIMPSGDRSKGAVPVRVLIKFPAVDDKGNALTMEQQGEYLRPEMGAIVTFMNRKIADINP
jgi:HlyD family secretion protein